MAAPGSSACDYRNKTLTNGTYTISPGVYCGGLTLKPQAIVWFNPGVYIMKDGPLVFQAGSSATGSDVAFYFTGSKATVQILGGADTTLKAPASGSYAGMLFVQDRLSSVGATAQIQGGGYVKLDGLFYMPTQVVEIAGNGDLNIDAKMFGLIADRFVLKGNGTLALSADYAGAGLPDVLPQTPGLGRLTD